MSSRTDPDATDRELVEAALDGRVRALDALIERHQGKVLRVLGFLGIPQQDREDVAQEVFVRVFRHLKSFRRGQEFGGWLYRVTVNAAHDHRARKARGSREEAPWKEAIEQADTRPGPAESTRRRELREALENAMETLTERERTIFVLHELEGLRAREVARSLGITAITVRRHLSRARRRLRSVLGEAEEKTSIGVERVAPGGSSHG